MTYAEKSNTPFLLEDHPRPNLKELPGLYAELDNLVLRAETAFRSLPKMLFDPADQVIHFGQMSLEDFHDLIRKDPDVMVPAFTRVCGLSIREFHRIFGLKDVYKLRTSHWTGGDDEDLFVEAISGLIPNNMHLETFLYTFYKMWEEHQRRHYRAEFEEDARTFFRTHGYDCQKVTQPIEINGAIPPDKPVVVMQVRTGVMRDLVKRAKEFGAEFKRDTMSFPGSKFIVVFKIPIHQLNRREEIRSKILEYEPTEGAFDAIVFQDELNEILVKFEEWGVPKRKTNVG